MPDYTNSKIYKIVCNITGEIYIGATTQKLSVRLSGHVSDAKKNKCCKSKDILLRGDYNIILIENYSCNNKEELGKKEREHIEINICVNKNIPTRTIQEWKGDNKETIKEYAKEYYEKNIEQKTEYNIKYKTENRDILNNKKKEYRKNHKEDIKKYYEDNKDKIKQNRDANKHKIKEYREKNRDELNRKKREAYHKKKEHQ